MRNYEHEATGIVETLLRYLMATDSDVNLTAVQRVLAKAPETRKKIMSIAEQLMQKGRQEGRREGRQEGRQEGMQEGLQEGREAGTMIGQIQLMQELLSLRVTSLTALSAKPVNELQKLATQLRRKLRQRGM